MTTFNAKTVQSLISVDTGATPSSVELQNTLQYKQLDTLFGANNPENYIDSIDMSGTIATVTDKNGKSYTLDSRTALVYGLGEQKDYKAAETYLSALQAGAVVKFRGLLGVCKEFASENTDSPFIRALLDVQTARMAEVLRLAEDQELLESVLSHAITAKKSELAGVDLKDGVLQTIAASELQAIADEKERQRKAAQAEELKAKLSSFILQVKEIVLGNGCNFGQSVFPAKEQIVFRVGPYNAGLKQIDKILPLLEALESGATFETRTDEIAEMADAVLVVCNYANITL